MDNDTILSNTFNLLQDQLHSVITLESFYNALVKYRINFINSDKEISLESCKEIFDFCISMVSRNKFRR